MTPRALVRATLPMAALVILACGEPTGPAVGTITVSLTSGVTDGAVLLTLTGPELPAPQPTDTSSTLYWRLVSSGEMRVMVFGTLTDGPLFTLSVSDVRQASAYAGTVLQVADRSDALRSDLTGYHVAASGERVP